MPKIVHIINSRKLINTLENVAINDVLPHKAVQRDVTANLKYFGAGGHQRPNFDCFIYLPYAAPPYSARISAIYLLPFGEVWVPFADIRVRSLAMKKTRMQNL